MVRINHIELKAPKKPPVIEFDPKVRAWYLRFSGAKVAKTISEDKPGCIVAIDLDAQNKVVGLELIGVKEFTISWVKKIAPMDVSEVDFNNAVFAPANRELASPH